MRNYNYYSAPAPPLIGGYGYGGYGGGGLTFAPSFGVPLFYGGGFFNILIFMVRPCCRSLSTHNLKQNSVFLIVCHWSRKVLCFWGYDVDVLVFVYAVRGICCPRGCAQPLQPAT